MFLLQRNDDWKTLKSPSGQQHQGLNEKSIMRDGLLSRFMLHNIASQYN